jgi:hypothetical protein
MRQRSLGILGGALLVGGIALAIGSGIAANSLADRTAANIAPGVHRPGAGGLPGNRAPGERGPSFGAPGRRDFPPGSGTRQPRPNRPSPAPSG